MKKIKQRVLGILLSLSLLFSCLFAPAINVMAANGPASNAFWFQYNKTYQIKNWNTWHNLNMWVTDANYLYNGTPVTMYGCYLNDNTQWFKVQQIGAYQPISNGIKTECVIASVNTTYALNIGYRVAGSKAVMYNRNLDLETWIIESTGQAWSQNRIKLKSNPSLCLAENPYTQEVYLEPVGASNYQNWYIESTY